MALSAAITLTETAVNTAANTSTVRCVVTVSWTYGSHDYTGKTQTLTFDGASYTTTKGINTGETTTGSQTLFDVSRTVAHKADGSGSVSATVSIKSGTSSGNFSKSASLTLTKIARNPDEPTTFTISAGFGNYVGLGDTVTLSWSGAKGVITGYEIQYSRGNSGWKTYKTVTSTATSGSTTDSFTATDIAVNGAGKNVQYRIRALNGSLTSDWKNSNILKMLGGMDLKVSNTWQQGSVWINVNGTWRRAKRVWINVNGTWKYSI